MRPSQWTGHDVVFKPFISPGQSWTARFNSVFLSIQSSSEGVKVDLLSLTESGKSLYFFLTIKKSMKSSNAAVNLLLKKTKKTSQSLIKLFLVRHWPPLFSRNFTEPHCALYIFRSIQLILIEPDVYQSTTQNSAQ